MINEIFYNAPDDLALEYVELYATSDVDLSSWTLADKKGVLHTFRLGTKLAAGDHLVLCREPELFEEFYSSRLLVS